MDERPIDQVLADEPDVHLVGAVIALMGRLSLALRRPR
jgi:hypothetical protein